jgi:hypothetical protein
MNVLDSTGKEYYIKLHIHNKTDNFYGVLSLCMKLSRQRQSCLGLP